MSIQEYAIKGAALLNMYYHKRQRKITETYHLHQLWLPRLANLVPLNKRRHSAASNWDFDEKKDKYFSGKENVSSYALTSQVLKHAEWKPNDVKQRQEILLKRICEVWDLTDE